MNRFILFLLTLIALSGNITAKENTDLIKANYYYNQKAFQEAIPFYEKIAEQANDPVIFAQLGDCYRLTGNPSKAAAMYDKAVKIKGSNNLVMLRYGQVLMQLTQYADAAKWLKEYQKTNKVPDRRVNNLIAGCGKAQNANTGIPSGTVALADFNGDGAEFAPTLWKGKLVFTSDTVIDVKKKTDQWTGHAYYNIYSISCDNAGKCSTDMSLVSDAKKLNIRYHNGPCTFSADGKQMYFTRSKYNDAFFSRKSVSGKDSTVSLEVLVASDYDEKNKTFKNIGPFQYNSADYSVAHASVSPNGKLLAFSSNMPKGAGGSDIYICKKMPGNSGKWSKPQSAGNIINTEGEEVFPYWADDNTLFFSSDGQEGIGGLDIYKTTWNDKANTFSTPENVGAPVNSSYDDISLSMFTDGRSTYFSSNRPAVKGGDNIWYYKREKIFLQINVVDSITNQPLPGAAISLTAGDDKRSQVAGNGGFMVAQLYPQREYGVSVSMDQYEAKAIVVSSVSSKESDTLMRTVKLYKIPPPKDTVPPTPVQPVIQHESVMDSPGIHEFVVDKIYEVGHFYFEYNKSELTGKHKIFLDTIMVQLKRHPDMRIELRAHTDCRGSAEFNRKLSERRALFVVNYLVAHGVDSKRLEHIGLGSSDPLAPCPNPTDCKSCTEEQHYHNRVLEFKVLHL